MPKAKDKLWWLERHRFVQASQQRLHPYLMHMDEKTFDQHGVTFQLAWTTKRPAVTAADHYAHAVAERAKNLLTVVEQMRRARMLMWLSPPRMAKRARLHRATWTDYHLATFTHSVVSALDCCLLLVAEVFRMGIAPKFCKLDIIRSHAFIRGTKLPAVLQAFNDGLQTQKDRRNRNLHRGERTALDDIVGDDAPPDLRLVTLLALGEDDPKYRVGIRIGWRVMMLTAKPKLDAIEGTVYANVEGIFDELLGSFHAHESQLAALDPPKG